MIFLNPAVLFGPVLIHLLNLRKLKKIEFSTLAFLKELQKTKIRKIKLKQWVLLALRILIILLLVAAFARPTVKNVSLGGAASAAKTSAVIILDDTYSMSIVTDRGSYFNQAKQAAKSLLEEFQEGDEVSIVLISGKSKVEATSNFSSLKNIINNIEPSFTGGTIHNSIIKAAKILSQSNNFNKEIYLLSDFQKNELYTTELPLSDLSDLIPNNIRIYTVRFDDGEHANLALTDFIVNNQIFEKGKLINFTAAVKNTSEKSFNNSVVSLFINGNRSAQQSFSASAGETKLINFETTLKESGLLEIFAELEDDDIIQDNKRYISIAVPEKIKTLIFYDKLSDIKFVELALTGTSDKAPISIEKQPLSRIGSFNLSSYDVIVIIGSETISNFDKLKKFSENGGSILLMPGSESTILKFNKLCEELSISKPSSFAGSLKDNLNSVSFEQTDFQHPIFINLYEKEIDNSKGKESKLIDSPEFYYFLKFSSVGSGKKIISLNDGSAFLSEFNRNGGRVLLFNSSPVLSWSSFPVKGIFPPLMNKAVFYLSSKIKNTIDYKIGDEILVNVSNVFLPHLKVDKPKRGEEIVNLDSLGVKNYLKYSRTEIPGIYKFYSGEILQDYSPVNINPNGSELSYLPINEFEEYLKDINFTGVHLNILPDENFTTAIYQSRFGSELWRYFIVAALLVALIEMFVSRSAKKDMV